METHATAAAPTGDHRDNPMASTLAQAGPGYRPLRVFEIDGRLYVVFTDENGNDGTEREKDRTERENDRAAERGESRGYLDVFDAQGNRVRRYSAIEHPNSEWELNEYVPVSPEALALSSRVIGSSAR